MNRPVEAGAEAGCIEGTWSAGAVGAWSSTPSSSSIRADEGWTPRRPVTVPLSVARC